MKHTNNIIKIVSMDIFLTNLPFVFVCLYVFVCVMRVWRVWVRRGGRGVRETLADIESQTWEVGGLGCNHLRGRHKPHQPPTSLAKPVPYYIPHMRDFPHQSRSFSSCKNTKSSFNNYLHIFYQNKEQVLRSSKN